MLDKYKFKPYEIYNVEEIGIITVQRPDRIVASKGVKQVGVVASAERGQLVTVAVAVSATGTLIPHHFALSRVRFREHSISNDPVGCVGTAKPSGWIKQKILWFL